MKKKMVVVSVSGGKDSQACAIIALDRHASEDVRFVFADTGNEHPATYAHLDYLERTFGKRIDVVRADFADAFVRKRRTIAKKWCRKERLSKEICRAAYDMLEKPTGVPFLDLCLIKGRFPSRRAQFCTTELKKIPLQEYAYSLMQQGFHVESWQGVRRDESTWRANAIEREDVEPMLSVYRPILEWTAQQVVDFSVERGIKLNPLYQQGMTRVGCMPCINENKKSLSTIAARFPEHVERIAAWERAVGAASKRGASSFFYLRNRMEVEDEDIGHVPIAEAVRWAKTTHGGVQYDLLGADTAPACQSAYGLCE